MNKTGLIALALFMSSFMWGQFTRQVSAQEKEGLKSADMAKDDHADELDRIQDSAVILDEIMAAPDKGIPSGLLAKAHCVVIVPSMKEGAFIVGAKYGKGVMTCRDAGRMNWTGPSIVQIEGGSIGFQIGGTATDVVLLVMNEEGGRKLMEREFKLGAGGKVAAGPVGRSASAETDIGMDAQILSYSRSKGLFAGVSLEGATLRPDDSDNAKLYGRAVTPTEILSGKAQPPAASKVLATTLNKYSVTEKR